MIPYKSSDKGCVGSILGLVEICNLFSKRQFRAKVCGERYSRRRFSNRINRDNRKKRKNQNSSNRLVYIKVIMEIT